MKILLIEDEKDLAAAAAMQLEALGHQVSVVYDLASASRMLDDTERKFGLVISDHSLPDGRGIEFILRLRKGFTGCEYVIVSGCLTEKDIELLEKEELLYYRKPLLYRRVMEDIRRLRAMKKATSTPSPENEGIKSKSGESGQPVETSPASENDEVASEAQGRDAGKRKLFGLFGRVKPSKKKAD